MGHSIQLPQKMIFVRLSLKRKDHQSLLPNTSQNNQPIKFVNENASTNEISSDDAQNI